MSSGAGDGMQEQRQRAYAVGAKMARQRQAREAPLDAAALDSLEASDILVVRGSYDHVERVLEALDMPYTALEPHQLPRVRLKPDQLLVINCPGHLPQDSLRQIRAFVEGGGSLFTTDWALRYVIEPAFPGILAYNERATADDVVRIVVRSHDNPFLRGVMEQADAPLWWLEGSSYPIRILEPGRVEVLIESAELGAKYGETPVAVLFRFGQGEVFHMISHFYLQRTELREARHQQAATTYAAEKGFVPDALSASDLQALPLGEVESAQSSARLLANIVSSTKRKRSPTSDRR